MNLSDQQFNTLRQLVYKESGINLHDGKKQLLQARLAKRLRRTRIDSIDHYLEVLQQNAGELIDFLNAISTNHTYFFREKHHFDCLCESHQRIWCAASSSGEEPYSIAIHCLEKGFRPKILASDMSTHVLEVAQNGIYPLEKIGQLSRQIVQRYFQKGHGKWNGHVRIKPEVRAMVAFRRLNLVTEAVPSAEFDVVFCRNILIYFDNLVKERVVNKLFRVLSEGGYLIIGGAESLNNLRHAYQYVRPSIYRRMAA